MFCGNLDEVIDAKSFWGYYPLYIRGMTYALSEDLVRPLGQVQTSKLKYLFFSEKVKSKFVMWCTNPKTLFCNSDSNFYFTEIHIFSCWPMGPFRRSPTERTCPSASTSNNSPRWESRGFITRQKISKMKIWICFVFQRRDSDFWGACFRAPKIAGEPCGVLKFIFFKKMFLTIWEITNLLYANLLFPKSSICIQLFSDQIGVAKTAVAEHASRFQHLVCKPPRKAGKNAVVCAAPVPDRADHVSLGQDSRERQRPLFLLPGSRASVSRVPGDAERRVGSSQQCDASVFRDTECGGAHHRAGAASRLHKSLRTWDCGAITNAPDLRFGR